MKNHYHKGVVLCISITIFITITLGAKSQNSFKPDVFNLKSPFVLPMGKVSFLAGLDQVRADGGFTRGSELRTGIILGLPFRSEIMIETSCFTGLYSNLAKDISGREFIFSPGESVKGRGYLSFTLKKNLLINEKSGIALITSAAFSIAKKQSGFISSKASYLLGVSGSFRLFKNMNIFAALGYSFNKNRDNYIFPDNILVSAGLNVKLFDKTYYVNRIEGKSYTTGNNSLFKDAYTLFFGGVYMFGENNCLLAGFRTGALRKRGGEINKGGIVVALKFTPGRRIPKCLPVKSLGIITINRTEGPGSDEYAATFSPENVTGPLRYEWKCSANGIISAGKWSPVVTVDWRSKGTGSFIELVISNRCSKVKKRISVN